ncbi:MAG: anaerobic glycerol-3-phosphate dehydrogenase subunit C [Chloroflexota bacterium]|nr:anaerobic glycerol-3-phosphate dehydrogenase subunit C [Chloroflexota bacterium]
MATTTVGASSQFTSGILEAAEQELRRTVSGEVRFDKFSRVLYSTDAGNYQMEPVGVVIPRGPEDVLATVEVALKHKIPVLPRCGATSLSGQCVNHAIVLDFTKHMDRVLEVNTEERWVRAEPGISLDQLNARLRSTGLYFPIDPTTSNRACVGGSIGNNSSGAHSLIYGRTTEQVRGMTVALSDATQAVFGPLDGQQLKAKFDADTQEGHIYRQVWRIVQENRAEIEKRFPKILRRVGGYGLDNLIANGDFDLAKLVVGSEGTLCIVTEARLNLEPRPKMLGLAVLHFKTLFGAMDATVPCLEHKPSMVEVMDKQLLDQCRVNLGLASRMGFVQGDPAALLVVEFFGESEAELRSKLDRLEQDMARKGLGYACMVMTDPKQQAAVWAVRKSGLGLLMSVRGDVKPLPFVEDTAVAPEHLSEYVRRFDQVVRDQGTVAGYYGHASVGCLHIRPMVNLKTERGVQQMVAIAEAVSDLVLLYGGALSGEHGDGIVRGVFNEKMFGTQLYEAFRRVKRTFDPDGIMNPGKIVDCPPMTENLRLSPSYKTWEPVTILDFSKDLGFAGAIEMCNGQGACRKLGDGTMCPSYMATREEEHSTRGRANLLRAALSGALPREAFTSRRLFEALDLCLECKGCKAECPSAVDMAKFKYEFLYHYQKANGVPLRSRLFASINTLSKLGSATAPLSNWALGFPLTRLLLHAALGIHRKRPLPRFVRRTFPAWFRRHVPLGDGHRGQVVLFNDTYMNYNYPSVGIAAVEVLEKAGFRVALANAKCCGRPMISKGLLDKAKVNARYNVDLLHQYAAQGIPILGCEPSCLLTLRDEYPELLRDDKSAAVAAHAFIIDEFLARLKDKGELELQFKDGAKEVLFHGHCHQKALASTAPTMKVLGLAPGLKVQEINSGCCGMAGAFGYEKEHYSISLAIGEQRLFPAIKAKPDAEVAVMGVSCRQQVEQGAGRKARHFIEVLRDALK